MALQETIEQTVTGLGYELVEIERTGGGLLRVTIDMPYVPDTEQFINAEDCEKVTRQLQFVLEVEGVEYARLEVSSPGIDRLLRGEKDFERFAGELVDITLKAPIGVAASAGSTVTASRKKFRGTLERAEAGWQVVWSESHPSNPARRLARRGCPHRCRRWVSRSTNFTRRGLRLWWTSRAVNPSQPPVPVPLPPQRIEFQEMKKGRLMK